MARRYGNLRLFAVGAVLSALVYLMLRAAI
jgi:hypothetical protein